MTAPAGPGSSDARNLLLVCPTARLVAAATEAGFHVVTIADTAGFTDDQLRDHLVDTVRIHRVGKLIACGDASVLPAVLETAERLGVSPNPAAAARSLADASQIRGLLARSGPQWEALMLPAGPANRPPPYDVEYGVETLTAEGMHRVTGIVELRFTGRGGPRDASGSEPGTGRGSDPGIAHGIEPAIESAVERAVEGGAVDVTGEYAVPDSVPAAPPVGGNAAGRGDGPVGTMCRGTPLHTFPAPLTRQEEAEIRALATGLLDLAGYEFGYAFTRIARTAQGPRVIESLPRQANWPTSRLIELTTGLQSERELVRALSGSPLEAPVMVGCAAAVPLPDPSDGPDRLPALADVREVRDGHALLTALTPAELAVRTAAVLGGPAATGLLPAGERPVERGVL
ncbi:hypothetical protein ABZ172_24645 [Streptomyces sp. NPDC006296]|uniref:hypothetical protein n=1 Tax=Streptomyces sp. NPDC006296 TaxID=3156746 RepID=UPI0033AA82F2